MHYLAAPIPPAQQYPSHSPPMPPTFPSPSPYAASRPLGPPPAPLQSSLQPSLSPLLNPTRRPPSISSQTSSYSQPNAAHSLNSPASQPSPVRLYQSTADSLLDAAATKSSSFSMSNPTTFASKSLPVPTHPDPIDLHVLSTLEAAQLFELFHSRLNCFIILLDRKLHTPEFGTSLSVSLSHSMRELTLRLSDPRLAVRKSSTVLFTSILAVSAKFFRTDIYQTLLLSAQQLVVRGTGEGTNIHIGLIQACLLLVYWKQPQDTSAWIRTGEFGRFLSGGPRLAS